MSEIIFKLLEWIKRNDVIPELRFDYNPFAGEYNVILILKKSEHIKTAQTFYIGRSLDLSENHKLGLCCIIEHAVTKALKELEEI